MINMLFSLYNFHDDWAKAIVSKYINPDDKVLIMPFSFGEEISNNEDWENAYNENNGSYYGGVVKPFLNYGIKQKNIDWVNYFKDRIENTKLKIRNSNIIFLTGGFPDKMMERLEEFDLIDDIANFTGLIIGSSAGAMIQIAEYHITPDGDYNIFTYNMGLNIIKNFDIEVHYEGTEMQKKYIQKVLMEKKDKVYGITDNGGIIVDNEKVILLGDVQVYSKSLMMEEKYG